VHVGDLVRVVHAGGTVFISAGTWISVSNIGPDPISAVGGRPPNTPTDPSPPLPPETSIIPVTCTNDCTAATAVTLLNERCSTLIKVQVPINS
jgi:hypothetical protein